MSKKQKNPQELWDVEEQRRRKRKRQRNPRNPEAGGLGETPQKAG